ncbi:hypothetical protein [Klebsiella sp. BIGb0407]|uniref:hypothetical protein n=1 Tax=Klebsiella sp. BIGb0407 TaxID=2940603 RepID=UPI00216759B1|nr:hypothetical protein [Klebsiella sp. BIGb0407]MCS3430210.1 hypothetical protein [Klebsiella sp. BIGb0407]
MRQVRDDWLYPPVVVTGKQNLVNVTVVNNNYNKINEVDSFSVVSVQNLDSGYFLILIRRMRVLFSKELPILKDSQWFFHAPMHDIIKHNGSHSHLFHCCKTDTSDYLLLALLIYPGIEPTPAVYDKNIRPAHGRAVDFLLFTLSDVLESQFSTTIIILLRQTFPVFILGPGLWHFLSRHLPTGNVPVVFRMGVVMSICGAQGKIENEHVFVSVFMTGFFGFTFGPVSINESEYCVMRQPSYFHPEDNSCDGH